ncbi:MerR family transcriptional regulator [Micromonospora terminaliae]|uniref:MerR family transcriptional regulator n=1 Tax=Micromonospora terminaliae TaxID=1914461 RepID=A0AAJ3DJS2_9ACTN|nr:MerR family transcriptional regulator [Micromonospora terminaliae]NES29239.1 MerR family transcriptional regulator [Micromonospora terminaliae]QGL51462.1 MerR family transcriptional regulator [Micromonospora terminaliae]
MRSIGELARASGLTVSALRFYDRSGVLVPALVDPATGYRWYADDQVAPARLVAGLRRVGMPLAGIAEALRHRHRPAVVHRLLDAHLRRLEDGLADARRELSRIRTLIDPEETPVTPTRLVLSRTDLAAAVDSVRFAVGSDPELPVLSGVLVEVEPDGVRLVATDRHRLAVARVGGKVDGPPVRALLPVDAVDELRALLDTGAGITPDAHLTVGPDRVAAAVAGRPVTAAALPYDFPDYRRLLHGQVGEVPTHRIPVDVPALRRALTADAAPVLLREYAGVDHEVVVLGVDDRGGLCVLGPDAPDGLRVGVNREYLLDALDAGGRGQLVLELDGPIGPLAVRRPDDEDVFSILMPVRL